jgi:A118 family predicted phage portal protein
MDDGFAPMVAGAAEVCSALGDVYLRPIVDRDVYPDRAFLAPVHADGAIPRLRWGKLTEVTFFTEQYDGHGREVIRLLEHHEVGRITYALFSGTPDSLGRRISLSDNPMGMDLAESIDSDGGQDTGLKRLDVVRVPNVGTQKLWRKQPHLKYFGHSDYDGAEQWFDALDETWTSWLRDLRLARARILVPEYMLTSNGPGRGATFDADREVFTALTAEPAESGGAITLAQFSIRHAEHKATADEIFAMVMRHAGLSAQTLGEEGEVAMTATEAQARERLSFVTRDSGAQVWNPELVEAISILLEVEAIQFGGPPPEDIQIEFGDSVSDGPETIARTVQMLDAADAISQDTKIRMVHPDWGQSRIDQEIALMDGDKRKAAALIAPPPMEGSLTQGDNETGDE